MTDRQVDRFLPKIAPASNGCWEWTAARHRVSGYGHFNLSWRPTMSGLAHRLSYEYFVGPIPDGLEIDHLCRNRGCVNPTHLEPVTTRVNLRRGLRCKDSAVWSGTSLQHRQRIGKARFGTHHTPEARARIGAANAIHQLGRHHSAETKAKMALARSAYWQRKREAA